MDSPKKPISLTDYPTDLADSSFRLRGRFKPDRKTIYTASHSFMLNSELVLRRIQ